MKAQTNDSDTGKRRVEKTCPIGWWPDIEVGETDVKVTFNYLAHNKVDADRRPMKHTMEFEFAKQEIIDMIPEEDYKDAFLLVNRIGERDNKRWSIIRYIERELSDDFEEIQFGKRSASNMYNEIIREFSTNAKYQRAMKELAKYEALMKLLKRPKTFQGCDIRQMM